MLFPDSYPVDKDDLCFIELRPLRIPLFTIGYPPLVDQARVMRSRITELDFMPVLYERRTPEWYAGKRDEEPVHELLLFFDLDEYDVRALGPLHGDKGLEAMMGRHMSELLPVSRFGHPEYTGLAEQGDDFVSLRYPFGKSRGLSGELRKDPSLFEELEASPLIVRCSLIKPITAERYRQAISLETDDCVRPTVPKGLSAGLRF